MGLFRKKKRDDKLFLRETYENIELAMSSWMNTFFADRLHDVHQIDYALLAANRPTYDDNAANPVDFLSTMLTPKTPVLSAWHGPSRTLLSLTFEATLPTPKTVSITQYFRAFEADAPLTVDIDDIRSAETGTTLSKDNLIAEFPKIVNVFDDTYAQSPTCGKVSGHHATDRLCRTLADIVGDNDIMDLAVPYSELFGALARRGKNHAYDWGAKVA